MLSDLGETYSLCCVDSEYFTEEVLHLLGAILQTFFSRVYHCFFIAEIFGVFA